ncbi:MAG TPA: hypothetical protein VH083_14755 [Myxococcales bacterium]|nr:hypothetical protein [Myxococcales bacterium]
MSRGLPGIALLTLCAFGCTTVRVPASRMGEAQDASGTLAPPMVELVLESAKPVPPVQSAEVASQARGAIAQAMQDVQVSRTAMGAWDAVLYVRERGVAQTSSLKTHQTVAKIAIVVAVAAVVVLLVASKGRGGGHSLHVPAHHVGHVAAALVPHHPVPIRPRAPVATRGSRHPPFSFDVSFWSDEPEPAWLHAPLIGEDEPDGDWEQGPLPPAEWMPPKVRLPYLQPPATFDVEERGYFTGPQMALQFDLADRATGEVLWTRTVASDGNPCDAGDVRALVVAALQNHPWALLTQRR